MEQYIHKIYLSKEFVVPDNPEELLNELVSEYMSKAQFPLTYKTKDCSEIQHNKTTTFRSLWEIFLIFKTYYPELTLGNFLKLINDNVKPGSVYTFVCHNIQRLVASVSGLTSDSFWRRFTESDIHFNDSILYNYYTDEDLFLETRDTEALIYKELLNLQIITEDQFKRLMTRLKLNL